MLWKPASFVKTEENSRRPVAHNTVSIPDSMVIASEDDVPVLSVALNFSSIEERTKGEVVALIAHMNSLGKFVTKEWVHKKLNFGARKADDIFTELKREGKIEEFYAIRAHRNTGTYWRIAGKKARREMQRVHARIRRNLRAPFLESINSPEGSLEKREEPKPFSVSGVEGTSLEKTEKISLRHQAVTRNYEDGSPGDGLNGTQYTEAGCFDRFTAPEKYGTPEHEIIETLTELSVDKLFSPAAARSAARRFDSGVINNASVAKMRNIIETKKLAYTLLDLIRNFDEILKENCEVIRKGELSCIEDQINEMAEGTSPDSVYKELALATKWLKADVPVAPEQATYDNYCNYIESNALPVYAKLFILSISKHYSPSLLNRLVNDYKIKFYKDMVSNRAAYDLVVGAKRFEFVNWREFYDFRKNTVAELRCTLLVNKLRSPTLDSFSSQLNFLSRLYDRGQQYAGVAA